MWSIVFFIFLFVSDKRLIFAIFLVAGIVQGIEFYFDYKIKQHYQTMLIRQQDETNKLFKKIIYSIEDV